jgi:hypothetical protein
MAASEVIKITPLFQAKGPDLSTNPLSDDKEEDDAEEEEEDEDIDSLLPSAAGSIYLGTSYSDVIIFPDDDDME